MEISRYTYNQIDKGMRDIIKELNKKNYITSVCCEGHIEKIEKIKNRNDKRWSAHIGFVDDYQFSIPIPLYDTELNKKQPQKYSDKTKGNMTIYWWYGALNQTKENNENERQELLKSLYEWAKNLPPIERKKKTTYIITAKSKKTLKNRSIFSNTICCGEPIPNINEIIKSKQRWYTDFSTIKYEFYDD